LPLGIVSNCWSALLSGENALEAQCRRALEAGYSVIELRQRALAEAEQEVVGDPRPWPLPNRLARLRERLPELQFHLAVEAPFISGALELRDPYLHRCIEAAEALGDAAFLRLVDPTPTAPGVAHEESVDELGQLLGDFAGLCWNSSVRLVIENARQPVALVRRIARRAAFTMPRSAPRIGICWDPVNMISVADNDEDPVVVAATFLPAGPELKDELAEVHYKQRANGAVLPVVGEGEVDWAGALAALRERRYGGPFLFEIPPGPDIWERLETSRGYVEALARHLPASGPKESP